MLGFLRGGTRKRTKRPSPALSRERPEASKDSNDTQGSTTITLKTVYHGGTTQLFHLKPQTDYSSCTKRSHGTAKICINHQLLRKTAHRLSFSQLDT
ncbi:hypothetical protein EVAR_35680_1 [Eumeta japonica]|uniref:Uncharacterized protein n=1 Tax=Eumeta variegata TaxID=151549 RepID=A0A4C1VG25_EUMVA|nr:hypothetical protein EVAR_35680_1 [Eumeta japonica]